LSEDLLLTQLTSFNIAFDKKLSSLLSVFQKALPGRSARREKCLRSLGLQCPVLLCDRELGISRVGVAKRFEIVQSAEPQPVAHGEKIASEKHLFMPL
jgi:hypothetical protein